MFVEFEPRQLIEWFGQERASIALTERDIIVLRKYTHLAKHYVEIGTKYGGSAVAVTYQNPDLVIDTYDIEDYPESLYFVSRQEFITKNNLQNYINFHLEKSPEAVRGYPEKRIDTLFIDGSHDYQSVLEDWQGWSPFLVKGSYVLFHDYSQSSPGVIQAVKKFVLNNLSFSSVRIPNIINDESSIFAARKL